MTLDNIYEDHMQKVEDKLDDYDLIRIPKPWEVTETDQLEHMRKSNKKIPSAREAKEQIAQK